MSSPTPTPTPAPPSPTAPGRRVLRVGAWALTITAALLAILWAVSLKVFPIYQRSRTQVHVRHGCLGIHSLPPTSPGFTAPGWEVASGPIRVQWWVSVWSGGPNTGTTLYIPLWPFILMAGVPGAWLLKRTWPPVPSHLCPACGYDRTGLPSATNGSPAPCPECGKK